MIFILYYYIARLCKNQPQIMFHVKHFIHRKNVIVSRETFKTQTDGISAACLCLDMGCERERYGVEDFIRVCPYFGLFLGFLPCRCNSRLSPPRLFLRRFRHYA